MRATNPNPNPLTIRKAVQVLQARQLSHQELVSQVLTRIQETDEDVIAWLDVRPANLLQLAEANDRRQSLDKPTTPLFGIPIGVKDIIDVAGYQTVCNMEAREGVMPAGRDADVVHAMRKAGVVYLGKTVTGGRSRGV